MRSIVAKSSKKAFYETVFSKILFFYSNFEQNVQKQYFICLYLEVCNFFFCPKGCTVIFLVKHSMFAGIILEFASGTSSRFQWPACFKIRLEGKIIRTTYLAEHDFLRYSKFPPFFPCYVVPEKRAEMSNRVKNLLLKIVLLSFFLFYFYALFFWKKDSFTFLFVKTIACHVSKWFQSRGISLNLCAFLYILSLKGFHS